MSKEKIEKENTGKEKVKKEKKPLLKSEDILKVLDNIYEKVSNGIPKISPPIEDLANQYLNKHSKVEKAAKSFINYQVAKCTTSGFLTGFGGIITLPVTIPANIGSVLYVQMRMIACIAHMGGYAINDDQTQTLIYACLAGVSVDAILKQAGIKIGTKLTQSMIKKIPRSVLTKINQKVGFRLVTKTGQTGIIVLGKAVPVVGAVIGGTMDFIETKIIAKRAYKLFIEGDTNALNETDNNENDNTEEDIIIEDFEIKEDENIETTENDN